MDTSEHLLEQINSPHDLRGLTLRQLEKLAREMREFIINTVAQTGGHLGANLGTVELTLALHTVFESPKDKLIWDTGHQTYPHKLLTGRREKFSTLRQANGISGFCKRKESEHDLWEAGHASTSVSAALGFAKARDLLRQSHHVVAVIGDGAMTAGLAFEGLNNIGQSGTDLIVVLNDNSMSISPNVGALNNYLSRLRTTPSYDRLKGDLSSVLKRIPMVGDTVNRTAHSLKERLKYLLIPGVLFEELGFKYIGPVDGHSIHALQTALREAKQVRGPVLVHAVTIKGKGYRPAERHPEALHGTDPFDKSSGKVEKQQNANDAPKYTSVFAKTLNRLAEEDPRIVAITAAMAGGTGLSEFAKLYPERFFDVGIAEQHAVTFAAGLASRKLKPVVAIYSTFLQRAYDQLLHDVCQQNLPVRLMIDRAGLVGADGETHQGVLDLTYLRSMPNMVIMAPKDENELQHMVYTALRYDEGPIAVRYPRGQGIGVPLQQQLQEIPIGQSEVLREGDDLVICAIGVMVSTALQAAERLAAEGWQCTVINARFVKPLDIITIAPRVARVGLLLTLEDNVRMGGFGSAVLEALSAEGVSFKAKILGIGDCFVEQATREEQLASQDLDLDGVLRAAHRLLEVTDRQAAATDSAEEEPKQAHG